MGYSKIIVADYHNTINAADGDLRWSLTAKFKWTTVAETVSPHLSSVSSSLIYGQKFLLEVADGHDEHILKPGLDLIIDGFRLGAGRHYGLESCSWRASACVKFYRVMTAAIAGLSIVLIKDA